MTESDRDTALALVPVSRETAERFAVYADLLMRWQKAVNLVALSTLPHLWVRHIADSAQLLALVPDARTFVDLGSGSGCPGLIIALQLAETPDAMVDLVESDQRKCAFLRAVIRETGAKARVRMGRIEEVLPDLGSIPEVVTARALAPIGKLLDYTENLLLKGSIGVFPKGREAQSELTAARPSPRLRFDWVPSRTDPSARIALVRAASGTMAGNDP
jgi:16S rRNA (guanine527-N7)-methyltransferase